MKHFWKYTFAGTFRGRRMSCWFRDNYPTDGRVYVEGDDGRWYLLNLRDSDE